MIHLEFDQCESWDPLRQNIQMTSFADFIRQITQGLCLDESLRLQDLKPSYRVNLFGGSVAKSILILMNINLLAIIHIRDKALSL